MVMPQIQAAKTISCSNSENCNVKEMGFCRNAGLLILAHIGGPSLTKLIHSVAVNSWTQQDWQGDVLPWRTFGFNGRMSTRKRSPIPANHISLLHSQCKHIFRMWWCLLNYSGNTEISTGNWMHRCEWGDNLGPSQRVTWLVAHWWAPWFGDIGLVVYLSGRRLGPGPLGKESRMALASLRSVCYSWTVGRQHCQLKAQIIPVSWDPPTSSHQSRHWFNSQKI